MVATLDLTEQDLISCRRRLWPVLCLFTLRNVPGSCYDVENPRAVGTLLCLQLATQRRWRGSPAGFESSGTLELNLLDFLDWIIIY